MTEGEAKKKWCPFSRVAMPRLGDDTGIVAGNRYATEEDFAWNHCMCIASDCMAWQRHTHQDGGFCGIAGSRQ